MFHSPSTSTLALLFAALPPLAGCGAGTAALVSGSGSGSSNAATVLSGFRLEGAKVSPATIVFTTNDEESDPARVALLYALPGEAPRPMTRLAALTAGIALDGNVATASSAPNGVTHRLSWSFVDEAGLPADGSYLEGASILAQVEGGTQGLVLGANADAQGLGNDAPVVLGVVPPAGAETSGVVPIGIVVADSSSDPVSLRIEFDVLGDAPDAGWRLARPSTPFGDETPEYAIEGVESSPAGVGLVFFWDTDHDLARRDVAVRLRVTADDRTLDAQGEPVGTSAPLVSDPVHVDNDSEPILAVSTGLIVSNPDARYGVPIPYRVVDAEGDEVEAIFQWRRAGEGFPALPDDPQELDAIVADPALRAEYRVCSEYRVAELGRTLRASGSTARLPELRAELGHLAAGGLVGRELELLRAAGAPTPLAATWPSSPLAGPAAVLSLGDGTRALVLDAAPGGGWSLLELELATGAVVRTLASASLGKPTALASERGGASVLVAVDSGGAWSLTRVALADGATLELFGASSAEPPGPVRGLASIGSAAAVVTVDDALLRLDFAPGEPARASRLLDGLATPWGVVVDPRDPSALYVAERDAVVPQGRGRLLHVRPDDGATVPVGVDAAALAAGFLRRPTLLATTGEGARLLALARTASGGEAQLVELRVTTATSARAHPLTAALPEQTAGLATGPDRLRLLAVAEPAELLAGGGLEQRRTIVAFDPATCEATVDVPFAPALAGPRPWRLASDGLRLRASAAGAPHRFLWDSADAAGHGRVFLRGTPRDAELGLADEMEAPLDLRSPLDVEPRRFAVPGQMYPTRGFASGDLDGDGDLDLVVTYWDGNDVTLLFQGASGQFAPGPVKYGGFGVTNRPSCVVTADLDGDGDVDFATGNENDVTVFFQTTPGAFTTDPLTLGDGTAIEEVLHLIASDLDRDGDLDLVSANGTAGTVTIFRQLAPGRFATEPETLALPQPLFWASAVASADLDGDADPDLAVADLGGALALYFQDAGGAFGPDPEVVGLYPVLSGATALAAGDLDGDGDSDLAVCSQAFHELVVFLQSAPGEFAGEPLVLGGFGVTTTPDSVQAADVDGDGDLDLVTANRGTGELSVFFQARPGQFEAQPLELQGAFDRVVASDLDGDGRIDLSANAPFGAADEIAVFLQTRPGAFGTPLVLVGDSKGSTSASTYACADVDGDGLRDLVLVSGSLQTVGMRLFRQSSAGVFEPGDELIPFPGPSPSPAAILAADVDGDGRVDLVGADTHFNGFGPVLGVRFQDGAGGFGDEPAVLEADGAAKRVRALAAADLDDDGDVDLVTANRDSDDLTVFLQTAPRSFAPGPLHLGGPGVTGSPRDVVAADVDGDGRVDLVSANAETDDATVFLQTAPGVFPSEPLRLGGPGVTDFPRRVAVADLDGDGRLDVLTANLDGDDVTAFFQTAPGVFDPEPLRLGGLGLTANPRSVAAADLDGDGDADVAVTNSGSDDVRVFYQLAPRVFAPGPALGGAGQTSNADALRLLDLDGDGDRDLLMTGSDGVGVLYGGR